GAEDAHGEGYAAAFSISPGDLLRFGMRGAAGLPDVCERGGDDRVPFRRAEDGERLACDLAGPVAEQLLGRVVHGENASEGIDRHGPVDGTLDHRAQVVDLALLG